MALTEKLLEIQRAGTELQKSGFNPHYKNNYIPLEEVIAKVVPLLNEHGIVLMQAVSNLGGIPALSTSLVEAETGETIGDTTPLILEKDSPQAVGSAITYMRRYSILSLLGLVADEDDDAEAATTAKRAPSKGRASDSEVDKVELEAVGL